MSNFKSDYKEEQEFIENYSEEDLERIKDWKEAPRSPENLGYARLDSEVLRSHQRDPSPVNTKEKKTGILGSLYNFMLNRFCCAEQ